MQTQTVLSRGVVRLRRMEVRVRLESVHPGTRSCRTEVREWLADEFVSRMCGFCEIAGGFVTDAETSVATNHAISVFCKELSDGSALLCIQKVLGPSHSRFVGRKCEISPRGRVESGRIAPGPDPRRAAASACARVAYTRIRMEVRLHAVHDIPSRSCFLSPWETMSSARGPPLGAEQPERPSSTDVPTFERMESTVSRRMLGWKCGPPGLNTRIEVRTPDDSSSCSVGLKCEHELMNWMRPRRLDL